VQIPYSGAVNGSTTTLGPFPFAARGVTVVNATDKDATVTDDRGISNVVKAGTIVSFPPNPTHYLTAKLSAAATAPASLTIYVSSEPVPITSSGLALPSSSGASLQRVSSLPASPADVQVVIYDLEGLGFTGVEWLCVYNLATTYWDVIGGPPILVADLSGTARQNTVDSTWQNMPGLSSIAIPNQGDYIVGYGASGWETTNTADVIAMGVGIGGVIIGGGNPQTGNKQANSPGLQGIASGGINYMPLTAVAGSVLTAMLLSAPHANVYLNYPQLSLLPKRIK
jgi:hypothetical protein